MNAQQIIEFIASAEKKTPVKLYVRERPGAQIDWGSARVYGTPEGRVVFGDWTKLAGVLEAHADEIACVDIENDCRKSAVPLGPFLCAGCAAAMLFGGKLTEYFGFTVPWPWAV